MQIIEFKDNKLVSVTGEPDKPHPVGISSLDFVRLVIATADLDMPAFSAISSDANLAGMWRLLGMASKILPTDPLTSQGLDAMVSTGHITADQKVAVLAAWPVG